MYCHGKGANACQALHAVSVSSLAQEKHWEESMMLTDECLRDLEWWYKNVDSWNCHFPSNQQISVQMFTDVSDSGWGRGGGASLNGHSSFGLWDRETARQSINYRELSAVLLSLQFSPSLAVIRPCGADNDQQLRHSCQYQSLRWTKLRSHKLDTVLVGLRPHSQGNSNSYTPSWHGEQKGRFIISYEQSPRVAGKDMGPTHYRALCHMGKSSATTVTFTIQ